MANPVIWRDRQPESIVVVMANRPKERDQCLIAFNQAYQNSQKWTQRGKEEDRRGEGDGGGQQRFTHTAAATATGLKPNKTPRGRGVTRRGMWHVALEGSRGD